MNNFCEVRSGSKKDKELISRPKAIIFQICSSEILKEIWQSEAGVIDIFF